MKRPLRISGGWKESSTKNDCVSSFLRYADLKRIHTGNFAEPDG
jgi:hypothetical protein